MTSTDHAIHPPLTENRPRSQTDEAVAHPHEGGVSLGRLFGVQIRVDWSLLIIFTLVVLSLGTTLFPTWHQDWGTALVWGVALCAAVLLFASVLAHELSHALVARRLGIPVHRITLFLFGGVAEMEDQPQSPKDEFLVAVVGPIVSVGIGLLAWFVGALLAAPVLSSADALQDPAKVMSEVGPWATLLLWLGPVNVILGVFNMVPGFPLDGGRVLRAFLWWETGNLVKASRWACRAGQFFAWVLMGFGVWTLLSGSFGGLWLVLIGWFLNNAARTSFAQLLVRRTLRGVSVRDLMFTRLDRVPPDLTAQQLVDDFFMTTDQRAFPVMSDGNLLGLVCWEDLRRVEREQWGSTKAEDLMTPFAQLATLSPDVQAVKALDKMARRDVDQIPVLEDGTLIGMVRRRDIVRWVALREPEFSLATTN